MNQRFSVLVLGDFGTGSDGGHQTNSQLDTFSNRLEDGGKTLAVEVLDDMRNAGMVSKKFMLQERGHQPNGDVSFNLRLRQQACKSDC